MSRPEAIEKMMIKVQGGKRYLPVAGRILWFRIAHPSGSLTTEPLEINHESQYAIFRATVVDSNGSVLATATKKEDVRGFGDYVEKAETGAVGRALSYAGFGTEDLGDDEMVEPRQVAARQVDSSRPVRKPSPKDGSSESPVTPDMFFSLLQRCLNADGLTITTDDPDAVDYFWTCYKAVTGKKPHGQFTASYPRANHLAPAYSILEEYLASLGQPAGADQVEG